MKKKGFTLIELLAVIVILAIIAVIATPMVLNTIDDTRKGAAKASAETYMRAIEEYMVKSQLDTSKPQLQAGVRYQLSSTNYEVASLADPNEVFINDLIDIKGDKPESGYVIVSTKGTVETMEMAINSYDIACANNNCEVAEDGEYEAYKVGDAVTIDGVGYHVTKASNTVNEYVTLLRDESIGDFAFDEIGGTDYETSTLKAYLDSTYKATFGDKEQYIQEITLLDFGNNTIDSKGHVIFDGNEEGTYTYLYKNYKDLFFEYSDTSASGSIKQCEYNEETGEYDICTNTYTKWVDLFWTKTSLGASIFIGISEVMNYDENLHMYYAIQTNDPLGAKAESILTDEDGNFLGAREVSDSPARPVVVISKIALD